jgi:alpha-mannosidase
MYAFLYFGSSCYTDHCEPLSSGMVYEDAEKLYAEVRADAEAVVDNALCVLYPGSVSLSSAAAAPALGPLTVFAHNTTPFPRRDIVRVPLAEGRVSSGNVLQTTSDGKEGYVVLEGGAGGGLVLPSQISAKDLGGAQIIMAFIRSLSLSHARHAAVTMHSTNSDSFVLGNGAIQLTVAGGRITSLFDVRLKYVLCLILPLFWLFGILDACVGHNYRRELIPLGHTGGLVIFEDHPNYWDAWGASCYSHMSLSKPLLIMGWHSGAQMLRYII